MAITFVGFYRQPAEIPEGDLNVFRSTGAYPPEFQQKIRELPSVLPETCKLIGSRGVGGGEVPGVIVVEAESYDDLAAINSHYFGWLNFDWHPVPAGGVSRD